MITKPSNIAEKQTNRRQCCGGLSKVEILKMLGSFLVPLLIGIFTIASTVQQYLANEKNRMNDIQIATQQRDQEQWQANELHQETVYAVYIQEMGELSLKPKRENLSDAEQDQQWRVARAKSLSAIRQLDQKRKSHLIQFLYETQFLFSKRSPIDLSGADLSGIRLTRPDSLAMTFNYIALTYVSLTNTSFADLYLMEADFSGSVLTNGNFSNAFLLKTNFTSCDLRNVDLRGAFTDSMIVRDTNLSGALLQMPYPIIANTILPNGSYVFYSDDHLNSDKFDPSANLITNGDFICESNTTNTTEIIGWTRINSMASVQHYSNFSSIVRNGNADNCVLWGARVIKSQSFLFQMVHLEKYTRLIDSGNASYEISFDAGGIGLSDDYVDVTADFRGQHAQLLQNHTFRKYPKEITLSTHPFVSEPVTNLERKNQSALYRRALNGTIPKLARFFRVVLSFIKQGNNSFHNGLIDDIQLLIKRNT